MANEPSIEISVVQVTPFQQNCTLIVCKKTRKCAIVDPGGDVDAVLEVVARLGASVEKIWITHGHLDHGGGAAKLKEATNALIEGPHKADAFWINDIPRNAAYYGFSGMASFVPDRWLSDGDEVTVGQSVWQVFHCPGHTPGHVVFYNKENNLALVGDVLFKNSVGRTDLPQSNTDALIKSITQKLWPLGNVSFIPGHGEMSSFAKERADNPFVGDKQIL